VLTLYTAIFWVSAATLFFELTLTRLFSVTQWYHFAFMSVSVALLGFGASGTWLTLRSPAPSREHDLQRQSSQLPGSGLRRRLAVYAALFSIGILIAYLAINRVPFDSYRIGWERRQLLYLLIYYSGLILPFFFAGSFIGLALAAWPARASGIYAANLLGSAVGSLAILVLIPLLGGMGAVFAASMMAVLAAFILTMGERARRVYVLLLVVVCGLLLRPPSWFALRISPYKALSTSLLFPGARVVFSGWNAFSRVDVVESEGIHSAPGLSLSFTGELPRQLGLMVDGGNLSPLTCMEEPDDGLFLQHLTTAFPFQLRPGARVLLVEPRAGLDIWTALQHGATSVVALESNPLVVQAVREQVDVCGASAYDDPRVQSVFEGARSYLQRSTESFDVLVLSLTDTYQPVISGAYGLSESYIYTVEALAEYLEHLGEDGILVLTRWMQTPPSEELRACVLVAEALERAGVGDPAERVLALRSWSTATLLAKRTPFRIDEIARLKSFCAEHSFDLLYYPGMVASEANQFNLLPDTAHHDSFRSVLSGQGDQFVRDYPYDISSPSDDRPFFFHYFKWVQVPYILRTLGKAWLPFGGGGFLILVALLALTAVLSLVLIWMPLVVSRRRDFASLTDFRSLRWTLLYFTCLGLGFLFVEMPLLQQFILFLGQPAYAFSLVLFSILFFSALGSSLAERMPLQFTLPVLVMAVLAYPWFLSRLFASAIHWAFPFRLAASVLGLAPLGFLLGLPMPSGIRLLQQRAPRLIPWAWAVNGCASVISSILAVMGAVTFGFSRVLTAGAVAYLLAWFTVRRFIQPVKEALAA
jgi:spermidine synthase